MPIARQLQSMSCVVPCHNEASNLPELMPRLLAVLNDQGVPWEIILVDDGSRDNTVQIAEEWAARQPGVRLMALSRNFGKEAALSAGLDDASGQTVVLLDADLQHEPELIPKMVERWRTGTDMISMVHADRSDEGLVKRWGTRLFYRLVNHGNRYTLVPDAGDFRLMDRQVVNALRALPERSRFMKGLYAWVGFRCEYMAYTPPPRAHGESNYGFRSLLRLSVLGLTAFSTWPLRAASVCGMALAALSFLYGLWVMGEYFVLGNVVSGYTTIVVAMLFLSGVQLVCLGVVGEYTARVFDEVKGRPLYVVRQRTGHGLTVDAE